MRPSCKFCCGTRQKFAFNLQIHGVTFFAPMEAFQPANLVNVEVTHAQSHPADLVVGHVTPVTVVDNATARKRQGNVVVHGGIPAGPPGREGAPGATAAARPPARKMNKISSMKRKKVTMNKPPATPFIPAGHSPIVPSYGTASTVGDVFDERDESGSNNAAVEFVNLLATNAVDIDQAPVGGFDYNELEGGVDDHSGEEEVEEIDEEAYQQSQGKKA
ncbi:galacturonosyltransferase 14 [Hordeum vulgare]|nr:galacturonosyltransferase 14 [Hordeum vulgare]